MMVLLATLLYLLGAFEVFDKAKDVENSSLLLFLMTLFWPVVVTLIFVTLIKESIEERIGK